MTIELLCPAKNLQQGCEAINHGADALYIGAPAFGARIGATNSIQDIESLVKYAHLFHSKVFVTINTLLFDNEINDAVKLIHQLYDIGVDALIIQDMGLLECDLPPIELHASTQTHNADVKRVQFLQEAGFKRVILARETSLEQMKEIRDNTTVELETFIHGALCVCYSGQCYLSEYINQRSGNRGCCSQPCRSSYNLMNEHGEILERNKHLLSLKDFNASYHIQNMIDIGITSFKIEGRLKDSTYVKNVTAYYRQLIDNIISGRKDLSAASEGHCTFYFTPNPEKTFNRGYTDYFLEKRQPMSTYTTQKAIGEYIGKIKKVDTSSVSIISDKKISVGDGLCYLTSNGLQGFFVNQIIGNNIIPNQLPDIEPGTVIYRNNDSEFEKTLHRKTAIRKIPIKIVFNETPNGISLSISDEYGNKAIATKDIEKIPAIKPEQARLQTETQLSKYGETIFEAKQYIDNTTTTYHIKTSTLNELRREACTLLQELYLTTRLHENHQLHQRLTEKISSPYLDKKLDYSYNIVNQKAQQFYQKRGAEEIEDGIDLSKDYEHKALMTTKYCIRYELKQCLQHKNNKTVSKSFQDKLILENNHNYFLLCFDCSKCQMKIYKTTKPQK